MPPPRRWPTPGRRRPPPPRRRPRASICSESPNPSPRPPSPPWSKTTSCRRLIPGVPLTRETVYICNVLKCRPPENRNPLPHEIETCSPYLRRQLEVLEPRIICCLGKFAAELLVGVKGTIASLRGRTYRYRGARLIVTY